MLSILMMVKNIQMKLLHEIDSKNTIERGSTALYTTYTVNTVNTIYTGRVRTLLDWADGLEWSG